MSKSLKNFVTIKSALTTYTAQQLRILFLQHDWDAAMDYSDDSMSGAVALDKTLREFIPFLTHAARTMPAKKFDRRDARFMSDVDAAQVAIDTHLRNNFNTKDTLKELQRLMTMTYTYINWSSVPGLLYRVYDFFCHVFECFGLDIGRSDDSTASDRATRVTDVLVAFRDVVRETCFSIPTKGLMSVEASMARSQLLTTCDNVRDNQLLKLGIKLEDVGRGKPSIWKDIGTT